jgi:DNA primase catalytic subunit
MKSPLSFYNRKDVQEAMVKNAVNREVAVRYSEGFGKRPDILKYPNEVLDLVKNNATSFHASEELWENPLMISQDMKKKDIEKLRIGWDLVLDIDSPYWKISKITAWLIIRGLKDFNIKSISVKFSGNKGFHIGVPFSSFPESYKGKDTKNLFPEAPRNIATYLLEYITDKYIKVESNNDIIFGDSLKKKFKISYHKLQELTGKDIKDLTKNFCSKCNKEIKDTKKEKKVEFICPKCDSSIKTAEDIQFQLCPKCKVHMDKKELERLSLCDCGSNDYFRKFQPLSIIEVDTILISSRHLFRMPYSMHEKSGLVSVPFNPEKILLFEKKFANPEIVKVSKHRFLEQTTKKDEAKELLEKAMEYAEKKENREKQIEKNNISFEALQESIPEVLFPPCIEKMLKGLEDGKKRSVFILINFLKCVGWDYDRIEKRIREWNKKNPEPLKETLITGQLRYHKRNKDKILPPNCSNKMYYIDMQICMPDSFCKKIKNPVNYAILKSKIARKGIKKTKN